MLVVGCESDKEEPSTTEDAIENLRWDRSAGNIVLRLDSQNTPDDMMATINEIPYCTLWGDGRFVVVDDSVTPAQVLQSYLTDEDIQLLVGEVIRFGFYSWESDLIPIEGRGRESIYLNVVDQAYTVERYTSWPVDAFQRLLDICRRVKNLTVYEPYGGWLSVAEIPFNPSLPNIQWPSNAPFTLTEAVAAQTPLWVVRPWVDEYIWGIVQSPDVQVLEGDKAYRFALQVPSISRDSLPPPPGFVIPNDQSVTQTLGFFEWTRAADAVVLRVDRYPLEANAVAYNSEIPACTIWGDGHLVLVNQLEDREEILEGYLSDETIRNVIQTLVNLGFYQWENRTLPPSNTENTAVLSIILNLTDVSKTVQQYNEWESDAFDQILNLCSTATQTRAVVLPTEGWVYAMAIETPSNSTSVSWLARAPFTLASLAESGQPQWLGSPWIDQYLWTLLRQNTGIIREGNQYYQVYLAVPTLSRQSPPRP